MSGNLSIIRLTETLLPMCFCSCGRVCDRFHESAVNILFFPSKYVPVVISMRRYYDGVSLVRDIYDATENVARRGDRKVVMDAYRHDDPDK